MLLPFAVSAPFAIAQEQTPQILVGERKVTGKKDNGPRAVAILQLTSKGKASLVPIAILIDGKFWDASEYKADPIPMALDPGTVYEAEQTGNSAGLFTVGSALHSVATNAVNPWLATGSWVPGAVDTTKAPLKAADVPVGIDTSDEPPRLTKNPQAVNRTPAATATPSSSQPSSPQSAPKSSDPDAPPRLIRPASESTPAQTSPSQPSASQPAPNPSTTAPAGAKPPDAKSATKPNQAEPPASDSGASESNRPRLRRGKAVAEPADDDVPGYSKFDASSSAARPKSAAGARVASAADQGSIQSIPAISDAAGPQPHSFTFEWLKDQEGERRQQMVALAKEQLRAYLAAQAKEQIPPAPKPVSQTTRHTPARKSSKTVDPILDKTQMIAYDLWNSDQPIIVFSAEAHMPPPPAGSAHSNADSGLRYSIMLVAYPDIYNNLHKLYVGVTDKYHLDVTPRLDLIDAVDADGDGIGELLFRETSDAGTGWVIYRATGDSLWKMFDSLNPE